MRKSIQEMPSFRASVAREKSLISLLSLRFLVGLTASLGMTFSAHAADTYMAALTRHITYFQDYPDAAKQHNIEGDAIIRMRVDAAGNIAGYGLVKGPGNSLLEEAIHAMIAKANPVPPPPSSHLGQENYAEFMLPIAFRLKVDPNTLVPIDRLFQKEVKRAIVEGTAR